MLSRISKISVFGIVALMLALGLATTDALAQDVKGNVTVTVDNLTHAAAAEVTLVFTVNVTTEATDPDAAGVVRIGIPSVWSRPINSDDAEAINIAVGEVFINEPIDGTITGTVSGRNLVANIGKDSTAEITFAFKTITPHRMATYTIPVSSSLHVIAASTEAAPIPIKITIGAVAGGTGAYTVTRSNGALHFQTPEDPVDDTPNDPPYQGDYIAISKDEFRNLVIRFTAPGTMPGNSTVTLTAAVGGFPRFNVASDVIVSGNADKTFSPDGQMVIATIKPSGLQKGNTITFSIKTYNAPEVNPEATPAAGAIEEGYTITVHTDIDPDGSAADSLPRAGPGEVGVFTLITTKPAGTGKIVVSRNDAPLTHIVAATEFDIATEAATLSISFVEFDGIGDGSKFEITVPDGWPQPLALLAGATARDGGVANTNAGAEIEGRVLKGNLNNDAPNDTTAITYTVAKIPGAGSYTFSAKATAGPHTSLAPIAGHIIEVVVADATGSVALLTSGGAPVTQASPKAALGNLRFVFTPAGRMAKDAMVTIAVPTGWTAFREDNGDGQSDPGEVSVVGTKATMVVLPGLITLTATEAWTPADRITVNYRMVSVPDVASATFTYQAQAKSHPGGGLANIGSPNIGIGRAPDGGGTLALSATQADAGSSIGNLTITYTAAGKMEAGSEVVVTIPSNGDWPAPSGLGRVELSAGTLSTTETTMTANTDVVLDGGDTIVFTYKAITAPVDGGTYTFTGKSKSSPTGTLTALGSGVTMTIDEVAAGAVALNGPEGALSSAAPGMALGNLTFVFTAGARMEVGSKVTVTIPVAWTPAFLDNNDGTDSPGESSLAGAAGFVVSGGGGTPWVLTATTNAILESGDTLMFTYKQVTAPSTEATYQLTAMASTSSESKLLPVQSQPTIVVREPVTAIALTADPSSIFTGGEIGLSVTLWAGTAAGRALGGVVIDLDDGDAGGTFTPAIITIGDAGHEGTATYTNATAGDYTITATAGDLDPVTADVEVKSTIRDLSVNGETETALLAQGSSIMVRATGPVGGGTVTILDSDGDKIGLKKALDPVGEPDADGDQIYSRSVELPDVLADGMYTVSVEIQGDVNDSLTIQVVNDQDPPTLSNASVLPTTVANGGILTLAVKASSSSESNPIASVTANLSAVDSTQTDMVELTAQPGTDNTYFAIHSVSMDNTNADGVVDVSFTATDRIGGEGTASASVTLANDSTVIESVNVPSDLFRPGDTVTITATGTEGGTATFSIATGAHDVLVDKKAMMEDPDGTYTGSFEVVADVFPEGTYYVTVNLNTKSKSQSDLNIGPAGYTFTLSIPAGTHAIHIPLAANQVNGEDGTIETVGDVYDALGDAVNFIITLGADGSWMSYLGDESAGSAADAAIGDDTGLIAVMASAGTIELVGDALGTGGVSMVSINVGNNLVGLPLKPAVGISMISDALVPGVGAIAVSNAAGDGFHTIQAAGDTGDGPVMGGVGYIVVATAAANIPIVGSVWENSEAVMAAPAVAFSGLQTPVLHVDGGVMDEFDMLSRIPELRVTVRNLSTGASLDTILGTAESTTAYSATFVEFGRHAAKAGDVLEIVAHSPNPYVGVRPVPQIVVSAEEVLTSRISLPDMELYEIPSESELLANYPNPFNPETWIPYRLAKAAEVTLDIYDTNGRLVRTIDIGFKPAAVYESRASAIYWDGRNNYGERVASGTYFYHLTAGDDYASTRRMVILK